MMSVTASDTLGLRVVWESELSTKTARTLGVYAPGMLTSAWAEIISGLGRLRGRGP